ncbi:DNA glycosylase [Xylaria cf. heliscus]|nr:DNA glycosylase [Xylaria cf. heliscus]
MSVILAVSCQPPLFLRSQRFFVTATSNHLHLGVASIRTIQTDDCLYNEALKAICQQYSSSPRALRGVSFQPRRITVLSSCRHIQGFIPHSKIETRRNLGFQQVASMSTRRSARLIAASELKASSSPSAMAPPPPPVPAKRGRKRKAETGTAADVVTTEAPAEAPAASKKPRAKRTSTPPPPTPTPSDVKLMTEPATPGDAAFATPPRKKPRAAAVDRLAASNTSLATLLSPETSRVVTSIEAMARSPETSPTKQPVQKAPVTANILEEANRFLISVDPRMRPLVENHHCRIFSPEGLAEKIDPFESLCSGIISQQVSGAAADSIKKKFINLFHEDKDGPDGAEGSAGADGDEGQAKKRRFPHPSEVVGVPLEKLRTAGLSQRKAEYVSGLAEKFVGGELSAQLLVDAPYEELIARLTAVRGLGLWSAEMFACFALKRADVFSLGDLGVQRGMAAFVGRDIAKLKSKGGKFKYMNEADMTALSDKFRPYRTLFMWYMWRVEETDTSAME